METSLCSVCNPVTADVVAVHRAQEKTSRDFRIADGNGTYYIYEWLRGVHAKRFISQLLCKFCSVFFGAQKFAGKDIKRHLQCNAMAPRVSGIWQ